MQIEHVLKQSVSSTQNFIEHMNCIYTVSGSDTFIDITELKFTVVHDIKW